MTDPNKASIGYDYDELGRLKTITRPGGGTVHLEYLDWGNPAQQRVRTYADDGTSDGLWADTYLDGLGRAYRVVEEGDAPGPPEETFTQDTVYSDASNRMYQQSQWVRSSAGQQNPRFETFEYDETGRLTKQTHPDDTTRRLRYGTTWVEITNEREHAKTISSDAYGRVAQVTEREQAKAQLATVTYAYDAAGQLLTTTDPNGNVTTNTWDLLGHLRAVDDPDLGPRSYVYDRNGNLKTLTDAKNKTLSYTYDALDRPETKTYPGSQKVTWAYDEPGHGAGIGRLTSVTDPSAAGCPQAHSEELTYDQRGQVTSQATCIDGRAYTMGFGYDQLGRQDNVTYPDNQAITYSYDTAGQLASMPGYIDQLGYTAAGQVEHADYANGTQASFTYDPDRQWLRTAELTRDSTLLYDASYTGYEPNGLVKSTTSSTNKMNFIYTHDELDRLTNVSGDLNQAFYYDAAGNGGPASTYPGQGPSGCSTNGNTHPCPAPHAPRFDGQRQLHYDPNGNLDSTLDLTSGKSTGIDWTDDHQPEEISDINGTITHYTYDGNGERVSKRRGAEYNRYYGPYLEYSTSRGLIKYYYAGSQLTARGEGGVTYWYQADHLGSTRLITNSAGNAVQRYDYTAFGGPIAAAASTGNDLQFAGQRTDQDNGLIDMHARHYDPQTGHFISPDTIIPDPLNTQALNRYSYVYNSPASYTDPTGHAPDPPGISGSYEPGPFSDIPSISVNAQGAPLAAPPAGQVCSACHGGGRIYDTPFDIGGGSPAVGASPSATQEDPWWRFTKPPMSYDPSAFRHPLIPPVLTADTGSAPANFVMWWLHGIRNTLSIAANSWSDLQNLPTDLLMDAGVSEETIQLVQLGMAAMGNRAYICPAAEASAGTVVESGTANAITTLGSAGAATLEEVGSESAFSGVYNPESGELLAYPSGNTRLLSGEVPSNLVPRRGGHAVVNAEFSRLTGVAPTANVGFTVFVEEDASLSVDWLSRSVNGPNPSFSGVTVPESMRPDIIEILSN